MKRTFKAGYVALFFAVAALMVFGVASLASAHSIDYTAYDIQPQAIFDGQSGHFRLKEPIDPGSTITFNLTLELMESAGGGTSLLPVTVTFGVKNTGGTPPPVVKFGTTNTTLTDTVVHKYEKVSGKIAPFMTPVTAFAPGSPGSYHFKIQATDGFRGNGLQPGEGIVVHFKVKDAEPMETVLNLTLENSKIIYRAPKNKFTATLTEKISGNPVPGKTINFYVNGSAPISETTDADGIATHDYSTIGLGVGDHTVAADFQETGYKPSSASATQCVVYDFLGFLPPVLVQQSDTSGLGIGLFQGKVIPVKIKIADYDGAPVTNAQARVYFSKTVAGAAEEQAVAIQPTIADDGSLMRYDFDADQYILNWNISKLPNGDYNIRIGMEEGECAVAHWVPVRIGKATK